MDKDEPPIDYESDLPESSGTWIDRTFWTLYRLFWPSWLNAGEPIPERIIDQVWISCPFCLFMRGVFIGSVATGVMLCGLIAVALSFF